MTKQEFLQELNKQLQDIPQQERQEAVLYYEEYFDEAEVNDTEDVLEKIDSPDSIAASIRSGLQNNGGTGEFTERGYQEAGQSRDELMRKGELSKRGRRNKKTHEDFFKKKGVTDEKTPMDTSKIILIVIVAIFTLPIWGGLLGGIFGLLVGLVALIFGLAVTAIALTFSLLLAGVVVFLVGIVKMCTLPSFGALIAIGVGCLLFGIGMVFLMLMVWVCSGLIPSIVQGVGWFIRKLQGKEA